MEGQFLTPLEIAFHYAGTNYGKKIILKHDFDYLCKSPQIYHNLPARFSFAVFIAYGKLSVNKNSRAHLLMTH
tara:strand:- start:299 stop:517 length:219 start_codon:yes stop_codon:yes gene_type:complete